MQMASVSAPSSWPSEWGAVPGRPGPLPTSPAEVGGIEELFSIRVLRARTHWARPGGAQCVCEQCERAWTALNKQEGAVLQVGCMHSSLGRPALLSAGGPCSTSATCGPWAHCAHGGRTAKRAGPAKRAMQVECPHGSAEMRNACCTPLETWHHIDQQEKFCHHRKSTRPHCNKRHRRLCAQIHEHACNNYHT